MDRVALLEKTYHFSSEAGMNVYYHRDFEAWWKKWDIGIKIVVTVFAIWSFINTLTGTNGGVPIAVAAVTILAGLTLLLYDTGLKVREYRVAFEKWQEFKEEVQALQIAVLSAKSGKDIERCAPRLVELESKYVRIETSEPTETNEKFLDKCQKKQLRHLFNTDDRDKIESLKHHNPREWSRLRYGVVMDEELFEQVRAYFELPKASAESKQAGLAAAHH